MEFAIWYNNFFQNLTPVDKIPTLSIRASVGLKVGYSDCQKLKVFDMRLDLGFVTALVTEERYIAGLVDKRVAKIFPDGEKFCIFLVFSCLD